MMGKGTASKFIRGSVVAATVAASTLMLTQTALASGGNGQGLLVFYTAPSTSSTQVTNLQWGQTYYVLLEQAGGNTSLWNDHPGTGSAKFNFFAPTRNFTSGNPPGNWNTLGPTFSVDGQLQSSNNNGPFFYEITMPSSSNGFPSNQNYSAETGPLQMIHNTSTNTGNDLYYFADNSIMVTPQTPQGDLPEVPYAGIIPVIVLAGGGLLYLRRRRKAQS